MERVARLEQVADRTWPALRSEWYDGWLLRFASGVTGRSNSTTPIEPGRKPLEVKVDHVVRRYREEGIAPMFRLTPLADPGLDALLAGLGWEDRIGADVMARSLDGGSAGHEGVTVDEGEAPPSWLGALSSFGDDRGRRDVMEQILAAIGGPVGYASMTDGGTISAIGMAAVADETVAIYNMATTPHLRRRGLGRRLLHTLLAWGVEQDASEAMLQVRPDNPAAQAMYRAEGFRLVYRYTYRRLTVGR